MDPATHSASTTAVGSGEVVRDNYIPIFDGRPSSYKERRKRITLYQKKMTLAKRQVEGVINLLTSFNGPVWKQVEHLADTAAGQDNGFQQRSRSCRTAPSTARPLENWKSTRSSFQTQWQAGF